MLTDECHKQQVPLCLYYSVVDWHHPNYPHKAQSHELKQLEPGDNADLDSYMAFVKSQIKEIAGAGL